VPSTKQRLVGLNQAQVHIRGADDRNRLTAAGDAGFVDGIDVILHGKIARRHQKDLAAARWIRPLRRGLMGSRVELSLSEDGQPRLGMEVVDRRQARNDRCQRGGDRWVGRIRQMCLAVDLIAMNLGLKGLAHLPSRSAEFDRQPPGVHPVDGQSMRLEPAGHGAHIRVCGSVEAAKLLRLDPLMKGGIARRVRILKKILKRRLLLRRALQQQQHSPRGQRVSHSSKIGRGGG
jgi:hypothetical protein